VVYNVPCFRQLDPRVQVVVSDHEGAGVLRLPGGAPCHQEVHHVLRGAVQRYHHHVGLKGIPLQSGSLTHTNVCEMLFPDQQINF